MMKNYFLTLLLALTFSASFSQLSITLTTPNPGDTIKANNMLELRKLKKFIKP